MSIADEFLRGLGNAVNDIREKVVEEPYFGRVVSTNMPDAVEPATVSVAVNADALQDAMRSPTVSPQVDTPLPQQIDLEPER